MIAPTNSDFRVIRTPTGSAGASGSGDNQSNVTSTGNGGGTGVSETPEPKSSGSIPSGSRSEIHFPGGNQDPPSKMYESKKNKKIIRFMTVLAYMFSVSLAAIVLSLYYIFLWDPDMQIIRFNNTRDDFSYRELGSSDQLVMESPDFFVVKTDSVNDVYVNNEAQLAPFPSNTTIKRPSNVIESKLDLIPGTKTYNSMATSTSMPVHLLLRNGTQAKKRNIILNRIQKVTAAPELIIKTKTTEPSVNELMHTTVLNITSSIDSFEPADKMTINPVNATEFNSTQQSSLSDP